MKKHVVYTLIWEAGYYYHGSTVGFKSRKTVHLSNLNNNKHQNPFFQNVFNKYGKWDSEVVRFVLGESEMLKTEQDLIDRDYEKRLCMNVNRNATSPSFNMTYEERVALGKRNYKLGVGVHGRSKKQMAVDGRKAGLTALKNKTGIFGMSNKQRTAASKKGYLNGLAKLTPEQRTANSRKGVETNKKNGTALYGMTSSERIAASKSAAKKCKEIGAGIYGLTLEQLSAAGKVGGKRTRELGVGIFGLTHDQRSTRARKIYHSEVGLGVLTPEQRSANGKVGGKSARDTGAGIHAMSHDQHVEAGKLGTHIQWHINRNIVNPDCDLCCSQGKA